MPNYTYTCTTCDSRTDHFCTFDNRPETIECACGGDAHYQIAAPNLMIKEAYLDGTRRPGFDRMKEASKLNKEIGKQRDEGERNRIKGEIKKLGVRVRKD